MLASSTPLFFRDRQSRFRSEEVSEIDGFQPNSTQPERLRTGNVLVVPLSSCKQQNTMMSMQRDDSGTPITCSLSYTG